MNGMDAHTRKHTQARYGEGAQTRRRKRHEKGRTKDGQEKAPRKPPTLLPLSIGHQRGRRRRNTTNRSAPASATQPPPPRTSTPWYGTKGEERTHTRRHKCEDRYVIRRATENATATNMGTVCYMVTVPSRRRPTCPHSSFVSQDPTREKDEQARKKTETHTRAEAGKKCMPGRRASQRRVEERVKGDEATEERGESQQPSKGRAQGRGHGKHTANTTPQRSTGEGGTRGTGERQHHAPRHAPHRHHTHRTHPTRPNSPPSGRAVGGGTAPDLRRPSRWWKAPPPGTPFRHPHSEQRRPARAHAVGPVLGAHARTDRTRDTRVAEPRPPAPEDGRPGEGQRLTPSAPHNGGRPPPPGTAPHHPHGMQPPQGM